MTLSEFLWNVFISIITGLITGAIITKMYREYDKRKKTIECLDIYVSYLYDLKELIGTLRENPDNDFIFYQLKTLIQNDRVKYLWQQFVDANITHKTGAATTLISKLQSATTKKAKFKDVLLEPVELEQFKINLMHQALDLAKFREELRKKLSLFENP